MTSFPDGGDLNELLAQMQQLQESVAQAEAETALRKVVGTAAGGAVRITASGEFAFESVGIDPSVVDPADVGLLEDLVLAALRDAVTKLTEVRRVAMGDVVNNALAGLLGVDDDGAGFDATFDEDDDDDDDDDEVPGGSDQPELPA
jgi:DNA-binding YbaB/EbfC family protein